jgi:ABC-type phosphate transport system substrate-binding protein
MRGSRLHRFPLLVAVMAVAAALLAKPSSAGESFAVVVNEKNPIDRLTRSEVSQMFLKRVRTWPSGVRVVTCDLSATHPVRAAFSLAVHRKPAWYVVGFWQQEIASGRGQPPKVFADEGAALAAVREDVGGIAYVSEEALFGSGLRRITLLP